MILLFLIGFFFSMFVGYSRDFLATGFKQVKLGIFRVFAIIVFGGHTVFFLSDFYGAYLIKDLNYNDKDLRLIYEDRAF